MRRKRRSVSDVVGLTKSRHDANPGIDDRKSGSLLDARRDRSKPTRPKSLRNWLALVVVALAVLAAVIALDLPDWSPVDGSNADSDPGAPRKLLDQDGDGIAGAVEKQGWSNKAGGPYVTDPLSADTDGDGLTDGEEAGAAEIGDEFLGQSDPLLVDTDDDGLSDTAEIRGWSDSESSRIFTDPGQPDTDADGLPDGLEAGDLIDGRAGGPVRVGISGPLTPDSDGDGIGDADEFFLDTDARSADSDNDGLKDAVEVAFGSDPTVANGDGDSYSDAEEYQRGSAPLAYDLTAVEQRDAAEAGAKYGDCHSCATDSGLRDEQLESAYYLGGQIGSGLAGYGDLRDLAYSLWHRQFIDAVVAGVGVLPAYGDAVKVSATVTKFAARSDRAARVAFDFAQRLPASVRSRIPSSLLRRGAVLPRALADGERDNVVYLWRGTQGCPSYVGITRNLAIRTNQHARAGRCFIPEEIPGANALTRGQAQAIEEACIVQGGIGPGGSLQNKIHSIAPTSDVHAEAVAWGTSFLEKAGVTCL